MKNKELKLVLEGDMEMDSDIWLEAFQQACAIAFDKEFENVEKYHDYVLDLTEQLYDNIIKGN